MLQDDFDRELIETKKFAVVPAKTEWSKETGEIQTYKWLYRGYHCATFRVTQLGSVELLWCTGMEWRYLKCMARETQKRVYRGRMKSQWEYLITPPERWIEDHSLNMMEIARKYPWSLAKVKEEENFDEGLN